jgi:phage protein D/phage baseplate assembly protein gpV
MPAGFVVAPVVTLNGQVLTARLLTALVELRVVNSVGVPAYARLAFQVGDDGSWVDDITTKLGDDVKIECKGPNPAGAPQSWKIFEGLVVSLGVEFDESMGALVIIESYDKLYKLGRTSVAKSYNNSKASDIITDLAGVAGLSAQVDATSIVAESTYRYGTAYAFLDALMRQIGYEWFVDDGKLVAHKRTSSGSVTLKYGEHLVSFKARYSASEHAKDVEVRGWDPEKKQTIIGRAAYTAANAKSAIGLAPLTEATGGKVALSIPRSVRSVSHATQLATSIADRRAAEALRASGEVLPAPGIKPGAALTLQGLGVSWSGTYYCTQVEHVFGGLDGSMRTFFEVGPSDPDSLVDIFGGSATPSIDKMLGSLTIGIVTNNNDTDGRLGRVKLKLPYLSDDVETGWARVLQPGAGANRGWTVIPEIDDEVLVGFEHGDIDRPYVLGGLANGKDRPKYESTTLVKDGKVGARVFNSRLGHEIRISDGAGGAEQFVRINTADSEAIVFIGKEKIDVQAKGIPVKVFNDQGSIEIAKNGAITLDSKNAITIKAAQDVTIEGLNVNLKSKANAKVEAGAMLELKASASAKLDGGGMTEVKGGLVKIN